MPNVLINITVISIDSVEYTKSTEPRGCAWTRVVFFHLYFDDCLFSFPSCRGLAENETPPSPVKRKPSQSPSVDGLDPRGGLSFAFHTPHELCGKALVSSPAEVKG